MPRSRSRRREGNQALSATVLASASFTSGALATDEPRKAELGGRLDASPLDADSHLGVNSPVTFVVAGDAYDRFMGRYSRELAPLLIEFARIESGMRVLDVGSGPGALAERLAERVGSELVSAADPSESCVAACAERVPGANVRQAEAERLPWEDGAFDAALAQLVVNFMSDPDAGVAEMRRVVRPGGIVGACTWDYGDGMQMLRVFWDATRALDPDAPDEGRAMRFRSSEELEELWRRVGFDDVETGPLVVEATYADFDDFWQPLTLGVGPAGSYCTSLEPKRRKALRDELFVSLGSPVGPFPLSARAWAVRGVR
jgi:SAM-dependent methyltransferase